MNRNMPVGVLHVDGSHETFHCKALTHQGHRSHGEPVRRHKPVQVTDVQDKTSRAGVLLRDLEEVVEVIRPLRRLYHAIVEQTLDPGENGRTSDTLRPGEP